MRFMLRATAAAIAALACGAYLLPTHHSFAQTQVQPGQVLISELRLRGPAGAEDEFVELYNNTDDVLVVQSIDNTGGWTLAKTAETCGLDAIVVAFIPNGTRIPPRRHYLLAGLSYSLSAYPGGHDANNNITTATPDQVFSVNIEPRRGIGLFSTASPSVYNTGSRIDAVGLNNGAGVTCALLREGTPLARAAGTTEYSFVRKMERATQGRPQDTDNNAADFALVSTTPGQSVGDNLSPQLGAPGPENLNSHVLRNNLPMELLDPTVGASAVPNREDGTTPEPCAPFGSILFRRRFVNNTGGNITRLRFRVVEITTLNSPPFFVSGQGELRVRNSADETLFVAGRNATLFVQGVNRQQPPAQPAPRCGGLNTSLNPGGINPTNPLGPGEHIDVVFRVGVNKKGGFRFFFNVEALP